MKIEKFEDLQIWKISIVLAKEIYLITSLNIFSKDYSFRDQIRRAVVSISSNIAEGFERNNNNEFIQFLKIAKGSIGEVRTQLYIAVEIKYLDKQKYIILNEQFYDLSCQVGKLLSYLRKVKNNEGFPKQ